MGNVSSGYGPQGARFAFDSSVEQRRIDDPLAGRGQAGSRPVFGAHGPRPPGMNFVSGNPRASSQPFNYGAYPSGGNSALAHNNFFPSNSATPGRKTADIFGGFFQSENGNCATISAIKASMQRFGQKPTDIFKDVKKTANGYHVTMRDGKTVVLTRQELQQATQHAGLKGSDPAMIKDASFIYAVSAKRAQNENHEGSGHSYAKALDSLKNGEYTKDVFVRLGLKDHVRQGTLRDLQSGMVGTIDKDVGGAGTAHSMAVIGGMEERWGKVGQRATAGKISDGRGHEWKENVLVLT